MIGFQFPGQGSQRVGMGKDVAERWPVAATVFEEADDVLRAPLSRLCFEGPAEELRLTENAQPALLAVSVAVARVLEQEGGIQPEVVAGHSLGEYTALVVAGALSLADALPLVRRRGALMQRAVPPGEGAMAAIMGLSVEQVRELCREEARGQVLEPANFNGGGQIVVAGHADAVSRALEACGREGGMAIPLAVSAPFHCSLMEPAARELRSVLGEIPFGDPRIPVVTNVEARPNRDGSRIADLLTRQVTSSVLWEDSVRHMMEMGVDELWEVGPGKVLTGLLRRIDRKVRRRSVGTAEEIEKVLSERSR